MMKKRIIMDGTYEFNFFEWTGHDDEKMDSWWIKAEVVGGKCISTFDKNSAYSSGKWENRQPFYLEIYEEE